MIMQGQPCQRAGFTLIEVLVALAVLAVGFAFAFRALSGGFFWIDRSHDETTALSLAETLLVRLGHDIPLQDGTLTGRDGAGYVWRLDTTSYSDAAQQPGGFFIGHQVVVTVMWTTDRFERQIRLVTLRLGPRGPG